MLSIEFYGIETSILRSQRIEVSKGLEMQCLRAILSILREDIMQNSTV